MHKRRPVIHRLFLLRGLGWKTGISVVNRHVFPQPCRQAAERECSGLMEANDKGICGVGLRRDADAVDRQKGIGNGKSGTLVAINKRVILAKAFPERCRLCDQISIIAGLGAASSKPLSRTPSAPP